MAPPDSTVEALALHYVGLGLFSVISNIWTFLAFFTAALSFWRLTGSKLLLHLPNLRRRVGPLHDQESASQAIGSCSETSVPEVASASPEFGHCATKGKFVAYYTEDEERDAVKDEEEEVIVERSRGGETGEWWGKAWRMRQTGWYDRLDLAVLNGSVVRLWSEEERGVYTSCMTSRDLQSMWGISC